MTYVDGFVAPVKKDNQQAYLAMATKAAAIFKEYGALHVMECWGDQLPEGKTTDFFMAVKATPDENVVFSWIIWPSKDVRDAGWDRAMKDERMQPDGEMPFDGKRMIWGGFVPLFDSEA